MPDMSKIIRMEKFYTASINVIYKLFFILILSLRYYGVHHKIKANQPGPWLSTNLAFYQI